MSKKLRFTFSLVLFSFTWFGSSWDHPLGSLWPSFVAISIVLLTKSAMIGLVVGAFSGSVLLSYGNGFEAFWGFFSEHLIPTLQSKWNICILTFSILMGGFVGLIEFGGGIASVLVRFIGKKTVDNRRVQWSIFGLGGICFFDGLANSMLVGRIMRPFADKAGISREKLSYLVDSTSSPIACIALISTWIAYQLSMIQEGLSAAKYPGNPYLLFLKAIPHNYYCLYTLLLVGVGIAFRFDIGPMAKAEREVNLVAVRKDHTISDTPTGHWSRTIVPLISLIVFVFGGLYFSGSQGVYELNIYSVASSFGKADTAFVLVLSSSFACFIAFGMNCDRGKSLSLASKAFTRGMRSLLTPLVILLSAWCLSSTLKSLGTAHALSQLISDGITPGFIPFGVFIIGALISFVTGTSWGTIGVLMPLAIPLAISISRKNGIENVDFLLVSTIAAVFSGAVFGDHCSPVSDTTIVSSVACEIEPLRHVYTQIPYALISAVMAGIVGFIPLGMGMNYWVYMCTGFCLLVIISSKFGRSNLRL